MIRAMLLAAGLGQRMRPLTLTTAKPLIQVGEHSLIEHNIIALNQAGISEIIINVSYQAKHIIETLGDGHQLGVKILYSYEGEAPLGTGGGIYQALSFFQDQPFLVLSADIWTDFRFTGLQLRKDFLAHLVMVPNPSYHPGGDYQLDAQGMLHAGDSDKLTYANIGVLHPSLFDDFSYGYFSLSEVFDQAIAKQQVSGERYRGQWFNVGTPEELEKVQLVMQKVGQQEA